MNKKAIGSVFVALALVFAFLKSYVWVMVGLLVAAIVFSCEEKQIKRIAQCLALVLSVLVFVQLLTLCFGGFASGSTGTGYVKFYSGLIKWAGILTNFYLIVFVVLGAFSFVRDKDMPLYGALIDGIWKGCAVLTGSKRSAQNGAQEHSENPRSENQDHS